MLSFYTREDGTLVQRDAEYALRHAGHIVWVDIIDITAHEEKLIEQMFRVDVPTRDEMAQIELSSRLYVEDGALFMTSTMISNAGTAEMEHHPVTFILVRNTLLTLRYSDPTSFRRFTERIGKIPAENANGQRVLGLLLETITDRTADILDQTGQRLDEVSRRLFIAAPQAKEMARERDLDDIMREIGLNGDLVSKCVESLHGFARMGVFLKQFAPCSDNEDDRRKFDAIGADISALIDHTTFLSGKINFLLDTTLGMLQIQQNSIIKIFSVAAVIFLPPTLVASIYGMNFRFMPELGLPFGYPMALGLMAFSAAVPYLFFRRKGWL